jgi:hypothetical protein
MEKLRRIYLCTHALAWSKHGDGLLEMDDIERHEKLGMGEDWPGRIETCLRRDAHLRELHFERIRNAAPDEGIFIIESLPDLVDLAREHFGPRCVVCRLENNLDQCCETRGPEFVEGLEEDRRLGRKNRGCEVPQNEFSAWGRSKAWALDMTEQLHGQGYTFDPDDVEFICFGENWIGCGATFPIFIGRALGLAQPIKRRFDWMNPDWSPMFLGATAIDQDLPLAEHVRLFIYQTANAGPNYGRYIAQFWDGMRGIMERPHLVDVEFPAETVVECDVMGYPLCRARGLVEYPYRYFHGPMTMRAGTGAHTSLYSTIAMAVPEFPLEDFRAALLAGKVCDLEELNGG